MRRQRRRWRSNKDRINKRLSVNGAPTAPVTHIDPATVNVVIPTDKPIVIQPGWTEIPIDAAFWRVWKVNSLQMRCDGYTLRKIDGKWRAFYVKKIATKG